MSKLYTRLANMISNKINNSSYNKTGITIGADLYEKINNILGFNIKYLNKSNIKIYDDLEITTKEEIEKEHIVNYYKTAINILLEMLSVFSFDYDKYLEYQEREYNGFMLYMFTEEFRDTILQYRNNLKDTNDKNLNDIYLDIESNIIANIDKIALLICNNYKQLSERYYFIPLTWTSETCLTCMLIERSKDEKIA